MTHLSQLLIDMCGETAWMTSSSTALEFGPRSRAPVRGPEDDLVMQAFRDYANAEASAPRIVFREPALPTGYPDLVAVFYRAHQAERAPMRAPFEADHLRLLHHVYRVHRTSAADAAAALGHGVQRIRRLLDDLTRGLVVRQHRDHAVARPLDSIFIARRIVAVEAKIRDWRRALEQAAANTWFASHSYVLLPCERFNENIAEHARRLGIGIMTVEDSRVAIRLQARRLPIPSSYGSWLINEWVVGHINRLDGC